ncbi:NOL12 protein, partial [Scopus umbretta]|nr:NOL12 protein [Scopus umbretta]
QQRGTAMGRKKKKKGAGGREGRLVVTFDEERRRLGLPRQAWQCRNERPYLVKSWALCSAGFLVSPDEADELEHLVTSRTESVNIDHPNHIVTVTTISDLDLSGARQLGLTTPVGKSDGSEEEKGEEVVNKPVRTMPKKSRNPFLSEKISSLTATLHMHSRKKTKGKRPQRGQGTHKKIQKSSTGRTTKTQRRRLTGKMSRDQD